MSAFKDLLALLKREREEKQTLLNEARKNAKSVLLERVQVIFNEFSWLTKLIVKAYTPSFNDGDPCTNIQEPVVINDYSEDYGWSSDDPQNANLVEKNYDEINNFCFLLEETFELAFGTDFAITFTRDTDKIKMEQDEYYRE